MSKRERDDETHFDKTDKKVEDNVEDHLEDKKATTQQDNKILSHGKQKKKLLKQKPSKKIKKEVKKESKKQRHKTKASAKQTTRGFSLDVEAMGLYGEAFSWAVTIKQNGKEVKTGYERADHKLTKEYVLPLTDPRNRTKWIEENVIPALNTPIPSLLNDTSEDKQILTSPTITVGSLLELRNKFWTFWEEEVEFCKANNFQQPAFGDCVYPVEANFFLQCVNDDFEKRQWNGPFPLHELQTLYLACKQKYPERAKLIDMDARLPNELPLHHPLSDARQCARLYETLSF